jgi:hypothetical protein
MGLVVFSWVFVAAGWLVGDFRSSDIEKTRLSIDVGMAALIT